MSCLFCCWSSGRKDREKGGLPLPRIVITFADDTGIIPFSLLHSECRCQYQKSRIKYPTSSQSELWVGLIVSWVYSYCHLTRPKTLQYITWSLIEYCTEQNVLCFLFGKHLCRFWFKNFEKIWPIIRKIV